MKETAEPYQSIVQQVFMAMRDSWTVNRLVTCLH